MEKAINILNDLPPIQIAYAFYTVLSGPVALKKTKVEEFEEEFANSKIADSESFSSSIKVNWG